jgi:putative ABC transport system ATP-binding protein
VGLQDDILRFGLQSTLTPEQSAQFQDKILRMRRIISVELRSEFGEEIEFYELNNFMYYSTIRDNIVCGDSDDRRFTIARLPSNPQFTALIREVGLEEGLLELGSTIARHTVDLLANFSDDTFFFRNTPMQPEEFESYQKLVKRLDSGTPPSAGDRSLLLILALRFIPRRHTVGAITGDLVERILEARKRFLKEVVQVELGRTVPDGLTMIDGDDCCSGGIKGFTPYCPSLYLSTHSLLDNILFGAVKSGERLSDKLRHHAYEVFAKEGLLDEILDIGLDFNVGSKGDRLSGGQQQKLAIARAFLRDTRILIMDEATASLDNASQARIQEMLDTSFRNKKTIIAVIHRLDLTPSYDKIFVLRNGSIIEQGSFDELMAQKGAFYELAQGN